MRKVRLTSVKEKVSVTVLLLYDMVPKICGYIWGLLEQSIENMGIHVMRTGREVSFPINADFFLVMKSKKTTENQFEKKKFLV